MTALIQEVRRQPSILKEFSKSRLPRARKGAILVGAGDSYSAAMSGFFSSGGACIALDPYYLASVPEIARGVDVFLISVSGKTASNLAAARKVRPIAGRTVAITSDERSKLARLVDEVVRLPMEYVPRRSGLLSYALSLLAVLKIAGSEVNCDFEGVYRLAREDETKIGWGEGTTYFLGNSLVYPTAIYAAAKTYEFLGAKAHPQLLEEFSHLELFSLGPTDVVNIFSAFDPLEASRRLARALAREGYRSNLVPHRGTSTAEQLFHAVFATQLSVLRRAAESGLSRPSFLTAEHRLAVSDSMIY
jgi:fructoselysine-6-P-deglycase FrlB-like protein